MRILAVLLAVAPVLAAARPFEGLSRRDQVALLYRPQFQFTRDGQPLASVGLAWGVREATFSAAGGLRMLPAGEDGVELPAGPGQKLRVRIAESRPARVRFWAAVRVRGGDSARAARLLETWRGRGLTPRLFDVGGVLGLGREVLDNRTTVVGLEEHASRAAAARAARRLAARYGVQAEVHEELRALPGGVLEIRGEDGVARARVRDLVWVQPARGEAVEFDGRPYRGTLYATFDTRGRLAVANVLPVEEMLLGVVPAEIFPRAPAEALKAQAVTARGEVLAKIGTRHFAEPFRMCNRQHCQVYKGLAHEHARTTRAVRETRGEVLWGDGGLVDTVYSAVCGGHTEDNDVVWQSPRNPRLRGRPDGGPATSDLSDERALRAFLSRPSRAWCSRVRMGARRFRWRRRLEQAEIGRLVARWRDVGRVRSIDVLGRGVSGRVKAVRVVGTRGELVVHREYAVRQLFGGLFSGMFIVEPVGRDGDVPAAFVFRGGGWGHGVGMCQTGAMGMAAAGRSYLQILQHYYRGGRVRKLY